jgi:hypothetical protein
MMRNRPPRRAHRRETSNAALDFFRKLRTLAPKRDFTVDEVGHP